MSSLISGISDCLSRWTSPIAEANKYVIAGGAFVTTSIGSIAQGVLESGGLGSEIISTGLVLGTVVGLTTFAIKHVMEDHSTDKKFKRLMKITPSHSPLERLFILKSVPEAQWREFLANGSLPDELNEEQLLSISALIPEVASNDTSVLTAWLQALPAQTRGTRIRQLLEQASSAMYEKALPVLFNQFPELHDYFKQIDENISLRPNSIEKIVEYLKKKGSLPVDADVSVTSNNLEEVIHSWISEEGAHIPKGIQKLEVSQGGGADFCVRSEGHCQRQGPKRGPKICCQADAGTDQFLIHEGYKDKYIIHGDRSGHFVFYYLSPRKDGSIELFSTDSLGSNNLYKGMATIIRFLKTIQNQGKDVLIYTPDECRLNAPYGCSTFALRDLSAIARDPEAAKQEIRNAVSPLDRKLLIRPYRKFPLDLEKSRQSARTLNESVKENGDLLVHSSRKRGAAQLFKDFVERNRGVDSAGRTVNMYIKKRLEKYVRIVLEQVLNE